MQLYYKGEFLKNIDQAEANRIYSFKSFQIMVDGEMLKKNQIEIRKEKEDEQEKMTTYNGKEVTHSEYIRLLEKEQEEIRNQTPEEKTFRNYKCLFCWKYLLQVGFTRFFETEDWKKESADKTFKRFDKKIFEVSPNRARKFTEESEQYFRDNPNEIWVRTDILNKFLPKGNILSKSILGNKMLMGK